MDRRLALLRHADYYLELLNTIGQSYSTGGVNVNIALSQFDFDLYQIEHAYGKLLDVSPASPKVHRMLCAFPLEGFELLHLRQSSDKLIQWLLQALVAAETLENASFQCSVLTCLGDVHRQRSDYAQAVIYYERAEELYEELVTDVPSTSVNLSIFYRLIFQLSRLTQAGKFPTNLRCPVPIAIGLVYCYVSLGKTTLATRYMLHVTRTTELSEDGVAQVKYLLPLGQFLIQLRRAKWAKIYLEQALNLIRNLNNYDPYMLALLLISLGQSERLLGKRKEAFKYFEEALLISQTHNYLGPNVFALSQISLTYVDLGIYSQAVHFAELGIQASSGYDNQHMLATLLMAKGRGFFGLKMYAEAKECFEQAYQIACSINIPSLVRTTDNHIKLTRWYYHFIAQSLSLLLSAWRRRQAGFDK